VRNKDSSFRGWTAAEAAGRIGAGLFEALAERRLILFGRAGSERADLTYFPFPDLLSDFSFSDRTSNSCIEAKCAGIDVFDIRVYPLLRSPNVAAVLGDLPLKIAYERLVLNDPEVLRLGQLAAADLPKLGSIYGYSGARRRYWPLDADDLLEVGELDEVGEFFGYLPTLRTDAAARALQDRIEALRDLCRAGVYMAEGDPADRLTPRTASTAHWSGAALWLDLETGDLVQERVYDEEPVDAHRFDDRRDEFDIRWRATMLRISVVAEQQKIPTFAKAISKGRVETKTTSRSNFKAWLRKLMVESPNHQPRPKKSLLTEAKGNWPDLSGRIFDSTWTDLIHEQTPPGWGRAGRRREANHRGD
jgi:hypothetical protein